MGAVQVRPSQDLLHCGRHLKAETSQQTPDRDHAPQDQPDVLAAACGMEHFTVGPADFRLHHRKDLFNTPVGPHRPDQGTALEAKRYAGLPGDGHGLGLDHTAESLAWPAAWARRMADTPVHSPGLQRKWCHLVLFWPRKTTSGSASVACATPRPTTLPPELSHKKSSPGHPAAFPQSRRLGLA